MKSEGDLTSSSDNAAWWTDAVEGLVPGYVRPSWPIEDRNRERTANDADDTRAGQSSGNA